MKTFDQFKSSLSESLPRQLGNALHGNLRYAGTVKPLVMPTYTPKQTGKLPMPSAEAMTLYSEIQKAPRGVQLSDLSGYYENPAKFRKLIAQLEKGEFVSSREHKIAGGTFKKYFDRS